MSGFLHIECPNCGTLDPNVQPKVILEALEAIALGQDGADVANAFAEFGFIQGLQGDQSIWGDIRP